MLPEPNQFNSAEDFQNGCILLIDKPLEWTSFDVVNKLRYSIRKSFNIKKIKVGHAGTLDPLATGLLVICTGKMTKQIQYITADDKTYKGTFQLGATTPSYDAETEIDQQFATDHINEELIQQAVDSLTGEIEQTPPVFSAKKVDGVRAYKAARSGKSIEVRKQEVNVKEFDLSRIEVPEIDFHIKCSKGTYIRSMAFDFGKAVNSGAYLSALRRTQSGAYNVSNALTIDEFHAKLEGVLSSTDG